MIINDKQVQSVMTKSSLPEQRLTDVDNQLLTGLV